VWRTRETADRFKRYQETIANDPVLRNDPADFGISREALFEMCCKKALRFHELFDLNNEELMFWAATQFPVQIVTSVH